MNTWSLADKLLSFLMITSIKTLKSLLKSKFEFYQKKFFKKILIELKFLLQKVQYFTKLYKQIIILKKH
ncbi:hypothetical protein BpHYR1_006328 [Brachionus plicatilis]|uniref:Uncharacterized protein n=1 Tax=Brachionus plicatilis TaxID=10195 RepID=A0A3M7QJB1_BRAPC|nr:hypothetical protein BpHYR1_006328 [Brachionus plicatilis]